MSFLGRFLVEQGAVTEAQLEEGLRFQAEHNRRIGEVAVQRGVLTLDQVQSIRRCQQADPRLFGDIAVGQRQLSRKTLDDLLFFQKIHHTYLGEALLVLGHIDHDQYQRLLGRHYALRGQGEVSLRYLQDFFAENRVAEILFGAFSRVVLRLAGEEAVVAALGEPFDPCRFPLWWRLTGTILDERPLEAHIGLSDTLAGKLAGTAEPDMRDTGLERVAGTLLRYAMEMLRDASLVLAAGGIALETGRDVVPGESLWLRVNTPTGEAGMVLCLQDRPA